MFGRDVWDSWKQYTPVYSCGTGVIGNGVTRGIWRRTGDSIEVFVRLIIGSTTSFQAGQQIQLTIPDGFTILGSKQLPNSGRVTGDAFFIDASNHANDRAGLPTAFTTFISGIASASTGNTITDTTPFTWATGDMLVLSGVVPVVGY